MSITTEVAPMDDVKGDDQKIELIPDALDNRDPNNLNEHLQVCFYSMIRSQIVINYVKSSI